ncbi:MAG TPA: Gfo/Idh/MocA family oxidoreductase [Candidatus Sumerlaeota bacterium]|nr:Gfo/Idh/MocA family oxidoreductase [Candidatus Sumerlaeota bacterium]HOR29077.1 Gfo/Idh/MocA family oxidoreductase [Candidatus Sumerlaeota bacterium]HPK02705.1 Gfo/Idh/MocA family oxidoreductase [Candidatus Sumerlaeota bacterium]
MKQGKTGGKKLTRRGFLGRALAAAAAPYIIPGSALGLNGHTAPSNRVVMASIGLGFAWDMFLQHKDVQLVAVCDVQRERRDAAKAKVDAFLQNQDCRTYNDFREVIARPEIDAVYIATPDHWHALVTIAAARAGKHIYCQKPLTRTIAEGQAVVEAVRRHNVVFQHGTQQRHDLAMLFGCELALNGYIGEVKQLKIGSPRGQTCPPQPIEPVPDGLDWEMWVGPAPWSPFTGRRIKSHDWYFISDYSMGYIAGWGVHHADSGQQASGMDEPTGLIEVDARGTFATDGLFDTPYEWNMNFKFPNGITWNWTDTPNWYPERNWSDPVRHNMGIRIEGTEGSIFIWRSQVEAEPKSLLNVKIGHRDKVQLCRPGGEPIPDFIECVRRGLRTCAPVEVAHRSTTLCSLGAISMQLGRKVVWDPVKEEIVNDPEAQRLCSRAMREPWSI